MRVAALGDQEDQRVVQAVMPLIEPNYDEEQDRVVEWGVGELIRAARQCEGIIVTMEGERWDIPTGGGVVRTSSAIAISKWGLDFKTGPNYLSDVFRAVLLESTTDNIYKSNITLAKLKDGLKSTKPPTMPDGLVYARTIP